MKRLYNITDMTWMIVIGILLGICFMGAIIDPAFYGSDIKELGNAICNEEYNMDFQEYTTSGGLICKDKITTSTKQYDGIKVTKQKEVK